MQPIVIPSGSPTTQPSGIPSTQPTSPTSQPTSVPTAEPTYDKLNALTLDFKSALTLGGIAPDAFMGNEVAKNGFINTVENSLDEGTVTITGASRRRLAVAVAEVSTTVVFEVSMQTNDVDSPDSTFDTFVDKLKTEVESGAFVAALQASGTSAFDSTTVDSSTLVVEEPQITDNNGGIITQPPSSMPTIVVKSSMLRDAEVNLIIGLTIGVLFMCLFAVFATMYYAKKYSKVRPQDFTDLSSKNGTHSDEALSGSRSLDPPKHYHDENMQALSQRGFHVKKAWEQKGGDDTAVSIDSEAPVHQIKKKPGYTEALNSQRPSHLSAHMGNNLTVLDDSDEEQEQILDLLEQRVTPKVTNVSKNKKTAR